MRWLLANLSAYELTEWQEYAVLRSEERAAEEARRKAQR